MTRNQLETYRGCIIFIMIIIIYSHSISFIYTGPKIYKYLPFKLRDYTNYNLFKINLTNWLM